MTTFAQALTVKQRLTQRLLASPEAIGVDVGWRWKAGRLHPGDICIRLWVTHKGDHIPASQRLPHHLEAIPTDVLERPLRLHHTPTDPLTGGLSIGPCRPIHGTTVAGTLGAIVTHANTTLALTNWHVALVDHQGHLGQSMSQPALPDGGHCPDTIMGAIHSAALTDTVDAALVSLTERDGTPVIAHIGPTNGSGKAQLGEHIAKTGRTSGHTRGIIDGLEATVRLDFGPDMGMRQFERQISIAATDTMFATGGDSGSVIVNDQRHVLGLYFAGSLDGTSGIANPINEVQRHLDIAIPAAETQPI